MEQNESLDASDLLFESGTVTAVETAAVTAVLASVIAEAASAPGVEPVGQSAWERSQRGLRVPLDRGSGAWRAFRG